MAHKLEPKDGMPFLPPHEVIERLRGEFRYFQTSPEEGVEHVGKMLAAWQRLKAPQEIIQFYAARQSNAVMVALANDAQSDAFLRFALIPDVAPQMSYNSAQHEEAARPLIDLCARILGYKAVLE